MGRIITEGPDGLSPWDKLSHIAVYKPHLKSNLTASSNAGATVHAYGSKVGYNSFGKDNGLPFASQPDKIRVMPFAIAWPTRMDTGTGIVVKAEGFKAQQVQGVLDNTDIYKIIRRALFAH